MNAFWQLGIDKVSPMKAYWRDLPEGRRHAYDLNLKEGPGVFLDGEVEQGSTFLMQGNQCQGRKELMSMVSGEQRAIL